MNKPLVKKLALVAGIVALAVAFQAFGFGEYFTLDYIKARQDAFQAYYAENGVLVVAAYMGIYIVVTALSLPGALVMTLAGGALFGLVVGTVAVSFASTIGATFACAASRYLLRDWVQARFGLWLGAVNRGVEAEGSFYLFTIRLVPVFPFFVVNLAMGLTRMPLRAYYIVSQIGMLPGTIVYVNAGRELGRIEGFSGILSPGLIASFVLLGIFPIAVKKGLAVYRKRAGRASTTNQHGGTDRHG
jgi:uncharacterized membrane protein YdjX (TVP38/TMEM64 family)